jgi:hypothetical protein
MGTTIARPPRIRIGLLFFAAFGSIVAAGEEAGPCRVEVTWKKKSGTVVERTYLPKVTTRAACEKAARAHRTNYDPERVESVEVLGSWAGRPLRKGR